ncbi:MAG: sulfotransferase [Actinomycetota bacterium]
MAAAGPGRTPTRVFVVGCPRSGTTLVQAVLAAHPSVFSFPESHYFKKIRGRLWRGEPTVLVSPRAAAASLDRLVADLDAGPRPSVPRWWPFAGRYGGAFAAVVDGASLAAGKAVWVEKSPVHLHYISDIVAAMLDARFIHVVRDGKDVVASIYELCKAEPDRWVGQFLDRRDPPDKDLFDAIFSRWNEDVAITSRHLESPLHHLVRYDRLVDDPRKELEGLAHFTGLDFDESMLEHGRSAQDVLGWRSELDHMQRVLEPLSPAESKFARVLSATQQREASSALAGSGSLNAVFPGS